MNRFVRPAGRVPNCRRYGPVGESSELAPGLRGGECPSNLGMCVGRAALFHKQGGFTTSSEFSLQAALRPPLKQRRSSTANAN
jgi:hypothetical protein